ncbi:hypothetical protein J2Z83_003506 [Virgibacillus natechei]|uniref:Uncharacterized protein n=1 Tax=Virgibacillus natechei TaxID=1216297 RepID=A0ABS4IKA5_9BACI|nr:hypothetical protein [Virgibacillus natechei]
MSNEGLVGDNVKGNNAGLDYFVTIEASTSISKAFYKTINTPLQEGYGQ